MCPGEYDVLCPGGSGYRPNDVTVILEGGPFLTFKEHFTTLRYVSVVTVLLFVAKQQSKGS